MTTSRSAVPASEPPFRWEDAVSTGSPQLDAADQILRSSWMVDLPIVPSVDDEGEVTEVQHAEVRIVALHWGGLPSSAADQMLLAVPWGCHGGGRTGVRGLPVRTWADRVRGARWSSTHGASCSVSCPALSRRCAEPRLGPFLQPRPIRSLASGHRVVPPLRVGVDNEYWDFG
eukprot:3298922-Amphidinium_carterae.1